MKGVNQKMARQSTSPKKNYVDNSAFLQEIINYKAEYKRCVDNNLPLPRVPNSIGKCLYDISHNLSLIYKFINYSYRDEMISDGLENAMMCLNNFDPEKTSNPFGYFTQVIYWAFVRRIQKEQKQQYIKHKVIEKSMILDSSFEGNTFLGESSYLEKTTDYVNDFVSKYESSMEEKKKKLLKKK